MAPSDRRRPDPDPPGASGGPLIGRAEELAQLERVLRRAWSGTGSTVLVAGEAGIGETRLVSELGLRARGAGFEALAGRYLTLAGRRDAALAAFRRAVELVRRSRRRRSALRLLAALGSALMLTWRHDESRTICERALALARAVGARRPSSGRSTRSEWTSHISVTATMGSLPCGSRCDWPRRTAFPRIRSGRTRASPMRSHRRPASRRGGRSGNAECGRLARTGRGGARARPRRDAIGAAVRGRHRVGAARAAAARGLLPLAGSRGARRRRRQRDGPRCDRPARSRRSWERDRCCRNCSGSPTACSSIAFTADRRRARFRRPVPRGRCSRPPVHPCRP